VLEIPSVSPTVGALFNDLACEKGRGERESEGERDVVFNESSIEER
jgi:hypothetical protein